MPTSRRNNDRLARRRNGDSRRPGETESERRRRATAARRRRATSTFEPRYCKMCVRPDTLYYTRTGLDKHTVKNHGMWYRPRDDAYIPIPAEMLELARQKIRLGQGNRRRRSSSRTTARSRTATSHRPRKTAAAHHISARRDDTSVGTDGSRWKRRASTPLSKPSTSRGSRDDHSSRSSSVTSLSSSSRGHEKPASRRPDVRPPSSVSDNANVSLLDLGSGAEIMLGDNLVDMNAYDTDFNFETAESLNPITTDTLDDVLDVLQEDAQSSELTEPVPTVVLPPPPEFEDSPAVPLQETPQQTATGNPRTGNPPSDVDVELGDDTRLPPRRPVLRLMDLVAAVRAANPTEIAVLDAALRQRFAVDSLPEGLRMAITCVHAGRFDAFAELRERSVRMAIQGASADVVLADVYAFMDAETGMLQDAGF